MNALGTHLKTVVITGVAGGIGSAIALRFKAEGWNVAGIDLQPREKTGHLPLNLYHSGDVSKTDNVRYLFESVDREFGRLDAIVNNAAVQICKPLIEMTLEEWTRTVDVNLTSTYLTFKYGVELLKKTEGAIVNISSVHAVATSTQMAAYAATKGGLMALTRALSIELAKHNVRVNAVLPGAIDTEMFREGLKRGHPNETSSEKRLLLLSERHLLGRIGQPKEVAQMVFILAEQRLSGFVSGQGFTVDGGATARLSTE